MTETKFDLLEGRDSRLFLKVHADPTSYILEVDETDIANLRDTLNRPADELDD
jgi:hypothetical protein